jgi:phospholipid transport system substrate-binding protein
VPAAVRAPARADTGSDAAVFAPVTELNDAPITAVKSGDAVSFNQRYQAPEPVIDRVFNLNAVLAASVGLSWESIPYPQKTTLASAFRRYTVSSYVANFNSYNGQSFEILPATATWWCGHASSVKISRPSSSTMSCAPDRPDGRWWMC